MSPSPCFNGQSKWYDLRLEKSREIGTPLAYPVREILLFPLPFVKTALYLDFEHPHIKENALWQTMGS